MEWIGIRNRRELEELLRNEAFENDNLANLAKLCLKAGGVLYVDDKEFVHRVKCKVRFPDRPVVVDIDLKKGVTKIGKVVGIVGGSISYDVEAQEEVLPEHIEVAGPLAMISRVDNEVLATSLSIEMEMDDTSAMIIRSGTTRITR